MGTRASVPRNVLSAALATVAAVAAVVVLAAPSVAFAGGDWNDARIQWMPYEKGLEAARKQHKPICLIFFTQTCPHCTNYARVFHDPKVVEQSKRFVMIRLEGNVAREVSAKHAPDGQYIPRTFFLSPRGEPDLSIDAERPNYKYFYSESDPGSVLRGMEKALKKWGRK